MKKRDHEYLYTVEVRGKKIEDSSKYEWEEKKLAATSMVEVSRVLGRKMEDLKFRGKEIIR